MRAVDVVSGLLSDKIRCSFTVFNSTSIMAITLFFWVLGEAIWAIPQLL